MHHVQSPRVFRKLSPLPLSLAAALLILTGTAGADAPKLQPSHGKAAAASRATAATSGSCTNVSWLNPTTPPPFLTDINQAAGTGDCQFQEFASQNFFALVLGASPAFATWPVGDQVYPADGAPNCSTPEPLGRHLTTLLKKVPPHALHFNSIAVANDILQAFGGPLVDQNGRYLQYEYRVNPVFCQTITSCQLYTQSCVDAALTANPAFLFPAGSQQTPGVAEVKLSWRVLETCKLPDSPSPCTPDDPTRFFVVPNVTVSPYSPKNTGSVTVNLGLTGFHLIQKTASHPEFIWATWEHLSNDPVCAGSDNSQCQDPSAPRDGVSTASGWSAANPPANPSSQCSGSTPPANCANLAYYNPPQGSEVDPNQPITQACRVEPCGGGDQALIASLNGAIRGKLPPASVWWNYFLVGTLWSSVPGSDNHPAGSVDLANTTMETYVQGAGSSCFSCHNSGASGGFSEGFVNLDFAHSLIHAQQPGSACTVNFSTCVGSGSGGAQAVRSRKK
jgi:hypothetical protein